MQWHKYRDAVLDTAQFKKKCIIKQSGHDRQLMVSLVLKQ